MSTALSELFDKILHSEQKFHDRITQIKTLNTDTHEQQEKFQLLSEEVESLTKSVETARKQAFDFQRDLTCGETRQDVTKDHLKRLKEEEKRLTTELAERERQRGRQRMELLTETQTFAHRYDLAGAGKVQRENQAKLRIEVLERELKSCLDDAQAVKKRQSEVANLKDVLALTQAEIEETSAIEKQLDSELEEMQGAIELAETERSKLSNRAQTDREFQKLQAELEACRDNTMEAMCTALSEELRELQRKQQRGKQRTRRQQRGSNSSKQQVSVQYQQRKGLSQSKQTLQSNEAMSYAMGSHSDLLDDIEWGNEIEEDEFVASSSAINPSRFFSSKETAESHNSASAHHPVTHQRQLFSRAPGTHSGTISMAGQSSSRKRVRFQY